MKILVAADSFKDALPAGQVCAAIARGLRLALPDAEVQELPLADGGEGTAEVLVRHLGGSFREVAASDPLGRPIQASFGISKDGTLAVVELAAASGLQLLAPEERNPLNTSTFGTGLLLAEALRSGVKKIALALGGSATTDGGMGMAAALGWRFLDKNGEALPPVGASLWLTERVTASHPLSADVQVICDVTNPLFGKNGAARVFAPQKGASPEEVERLDAGLRHFSKVVENQLKRPGLADVPGAGAAGGAGFGAMAFLSATLHRGIELVLDWTGFDATLADADLVVTGEGRLDSQTLHGKLVHGICQRAKARGKPVVALCGSLLLPPDGIEALGLAAAFSILKKPGDLADALRETERGLEETAFSVGRAARLYAGTPVPASGLYAGTPVPASAVPELGFRRTPLEQTWRWFGPQDPVSLADIRQAGAEGVVTALHHVPNGETWTAEEILKRKTEVEAAGLRWSVVESVPVHEDIKKRAGDHLRHLENYRQTLRNLAAAGIRTVCYNFMPVLDWTRTDLDFRLPDGASALRFDHTEFAAFDLFLLKRPGAEADHPPALRQAARRRFDEMNSEQRLRLTANILAGLPGSEESWSLESFQAALDGYRSVSAGRLRANLVFFLKNVAPAAEEAGVRLTLHPDDPPFPLLGLPRVVSTEADVRAIFRAVPSPASGLCFCTGSFGAHPGNDLPGMARRLARRIHFAHLRSVRREADGSFHEASHLEGDCEMPAVMCCLLAEALRRRKSGDKRWLIPFRPDHGHKMLDDLRKTTLPGYSAIGRLRGLAELRGLEMGILKSGRELPGIPP